LTEDSQDLLSPADDTTHTRLYTETTVYFHFSRSLYPFSNHLDTLRLTRRSRRLVSILATTSTLAATTSIESRHSRRNRTTRTDVPSHLIRLSTGPNPSAIRSDMFHMGFKGLSVLVWKVLGPSRRFIAIFLDFRTSLWTASSLTYLFRNLFIFSLHPWSFCYSFGRYFVLFYYLVWLYPSLIIFSINTPSKFQ
jgi:hypothetical protein